MAGALFAAETKACLPFFGCALEVHRSDPFDIVAPCPAVMTKSPALHEAVTYPGPDLIQLGVSFCTNGLITKIDRQVPGLRCRRQGADGKVACRYDRCSGRCQILEVSYRRS